MAEDTATTEITYEDGYEELKTIVTRLDADDVSVHEMCQLFARGKGLERALRGYLTTQQGKLDEIEAGENLPEFVIAAPSDPTAEEGETEPGELTWDDGDFETAPPAPAPASDDDIPF